MTRASATVIAAGPVTVAASPFDSGRPPLVQIAPLARQIPVAGSWMDPSPCPSGGTVMFQLWSLPDCWRCAFRTVPPLTLNASSRSVRKPTCGASLKG
ncbi:MAG: hypothetical protein OXG35_08465 [Acidobacteria bacterium]|nr:hypothetical protein [Acidobacteriota bacterium]